MTGEHILIALGSVDDALLELCETYRAPRRMPWKAMAAAACVALAILAGAAALRHTRVPASPKPDAPQTAPTCETVAAQYSQTAAPGETENSQLAPQYGNETASETTAPAVGTTVTQQNGSADVYEGQDGKSGEIRELPTGTAPQQGTKDLFRDAPITTKYPTMTWQGKTYMSRGNSDPSAKAQKTVLGTAELTGFDGLHRTTVKVLPIGGVSQAAALAVQFPDSDRYYTYVCASFAPATLGEYVDAFALWDNASCTRLSGCSRKYAATIYPAPSAELLRSLFDRGAKRADMREYDCPQDMTIDCIAPAFGVRGSAFGVSEAGYLLCRMTDSTVIYYVGPERAKAFLDAVDAGDATRLVQTTGAYTVQSTRETP